MPLNENNAKISPDQIISDLGGCGPYQMRINIATHLMKSLICWSTTSMVLFSLTPPWWCVETHPMNETIDNRYTASPITLEHVASTMKTTTADNHKENATSMTDALFKSCSTRNGEKCTMYRFVGSATLVSEFDLVCDAAFAPSMMMSIQSAGSFVGNIIAGQISDLFGRKRPFFGAVALATTANFVGFFSNSWALYATSRFFGGVAATAFITTMYSLLSEFSLAQHRAWIIGIPSWPIEACVFAGLAYLVKEWRYLQLANALIGIPCLMTWWIIPESFRWYLAHDRKADAERVLRKVATVNKKAPVSLQQLENIKFTEDEEEQGRKYTFVDVFKSRYLIKVTMLMAINWIGMGFISYGVFFGIQALSGDIYMNLFLFSVSGVPGKAIAIGLENKIGRRQTAILCFFISAVGCLAAGIVNYIDTPLRGPLINGFAIFANVGIATMWGPIQTMTVELYPTVIRTIGFGVQSTMARVGAILAPQFVFLSTRIPGLMYLTCGGLSIVCMIALLGLAETKNANLNDKIAETKKKIGTLTTQA